MDDKFLVEDENGLTKEANILSFFDYQNKKYLLYSISKNENEDDIYVSEVIKDSEGYDTLKDIEDSSIKEELDEVVEELLKKIDNKE